MCASWPEKINIIGQGGEQESECSMQMCYGQQIVGQKPTD